MFKRVLVLVIFLFGVFWWLTNRDSEPKEPANETEVVTVETEDAEEAEDSETTETSEEGNEETAEANETETEVETSAETEEETTTVTTNVTTTTPTQPAVVMPAVTTPTTTTSTTTTAPVQPVVVTPTVPARTTDVKVYLYEWGLDLSDKTIPAGTVNFQVQNDGRFTHDFSVSGFGNLGKVTPNEKTTFTVKLAAGEYEAFSKRRQDYERGLKENFTVVQ